MYRLQVKSHFDAAHYIKDYPGKCKRMHGHRWEVEAVLEGKELDALNMLIDFSLVKGWLKSILEDLDHYVLNEQLPELTQDGESDNVTAEYLAKWLFLGLDTKLQFASPTFLPHLPVRLVCVTVWESPDCCVKYYERSE